MPKRTDIKSILLIGSGPIVIGQACEFDYSGTQALRALREEGYRVILVNSNPATIMTDPELSDRVYVEPLTPEFVERVIELEKPDALLPTMGGQTALNLTMTLHRSGVLARHGVKILGASPESIERAEDREKFKRVMDSIGVESAKSRVIHSLEEGRKALEEMGLPLILRPSFTLGGEGGGAATEAGDFLKKLERALFLSPTREVLVEESLTGWKEFELEVVRDRKDNVIIICSIENFDPMGVHTGDSITVAPAQTLTDREFQMLRDQSKKIIRAIGVETGGSNIQFALNPKDGRIIVIEMNPRVSRSSALASKATGFPIARVAAKLAVGYTLDELTNDITGTTPCSFEPSLDYVVTKIPRFDFEKFRPTEPMLTTQMKSVGEVMAIGRSFEESLGKALAGLEVTPPWLAPFKEDRTPRWEWIDSPHPRRIWAVADALRKGASVEEIHGRCGIDPWFLGRIEYYLEGEKILLEQKQPPPRDALRKLKARGWTDYAIAQVLGKTENEVRDWGGNPTFHCVDTCAAEFEAKTPYLYSSYHGSEASSESTRSARPKIMILGGGPNRIGQGIEFDYCCVHAAMALRELGFETIMVNSNPETVSTDFDVSDKLYFEPLTAEHVLAITRLEQPQGVIVQFGGQTPLKLAQALKTAGVPILGTSPESIDLAEDRAKFEALVRDMHSLGLQQPEAATAFTREEAISKAEKLGYPVVVRPSYVLGGKAMRVVRNTESLAQWIDEAIEISGKHPVLIDRFLDHAIEVDVDAISDGQCTWIGGVMEHIEEAGIHSGDSACSLPPASLAEPIVQKIRDYARELAKRLNVVGLMNAQFAIQGDQIYLLEVNPRASRTIPFVSKAVGRPLAKIAAQVMAGRTLASLGVHGDFDRELSRFHVKAPVFPFSKFPQADTVLGPEMKSTGEVMGRGKTFAEAYAKAWIATGMNLPSAGKAFLSIRDEDKIGFIKIAAAYVDLGFELWATQGTADYLKKNGLKATQINKVHQGSPHCVEAISSGQFQLVINTASDEQAIRDSFSIRRAALERKIPYCTVISAARALAEGLQAQRFGGFSVEPLTMKALSSSPRLP